MIVRRSLFSTLGTGEKKMFTSKHGILMKSILIPSILFLLSLKLRQNTCGYSIQSKKGSKPKDTIVLQPQESKMFWDSYTAIWPTTDSIAFIDLFRTDKYIIEGLKLFELKKKLNLTSRKTPCHAARVTSFALGVLHYDH